MVNYVAVVFTEIYKIKSSTNLKDKNLKNLTTLQIKTSIFS